MPVIKVEGKTIEISSDGESIKIVNFLSADEAREILEEDKEKLRQSRAEKFHSDVLTKIVKALGLKMNDCKDILEDIMDVQIKTFKDLQKVYSTGLDISLTFQLTPPRAIFSSGSEVASVPLTGGEEFFMGLRSALINK